MAHTLPSVVCKGTDAVTPDWPEGKYGVIYADPPWHFKNWSEKGEEKNATSHYDCLTYEELAKLPVADLAAKNCVLFLWVTDPLLKRGFDLMQAWGFDYKTVGFYWVKLNRRWHSNADFFLGLGYWTRANPEMCLLGTRGRPKPLSRSVRRLLVAPRLEHSRKPELARHRIEQLCSGPYVELFARQRWPGWSSWGDEVGKFEEPLLCTR